MATSATYPVLVAAMGSFGPRAQALALEVAGKPAFVSAVVEESRTDPGLRVVFAPSAEAQRRPGMGAAADTAFYQSAASVSQSASGSGFLSFIPAAGAATALFVNQLGDAIPSISAAFGNKKALAVVTARSQLAAQQAAEATAQARAPYEGQAAEAASRATEIGYAAAGVAVFGIALAVAFALSGRSSRRSNRARISRTRSNGMTCLGRYYARKRAA